VLSAKVTYAVNVYLSLIKKDVAPRQAYATACELAGLTTAAERAELRKALTS